MTVYAVPTLQTILGVGLETVPYTAVPPTAFIPVASAPKPVDVLKYDQDKGMRGSMGVDYGFVPGVSSTTYDYDSYVFADTVGWVLAGVLGTDTTTGSAAPYSHKFTLYNGTFGQPPTYTLTDWYSANGREYPGCVFSGFSLKVSGDGLLSYTASAVGMPSVSLAGAKPAASYTTVKALSGWQGVVQLGGATVKNILTLDLDIKRKVSPINPVAGVQSPASIFAADLAVTGKMTAVMADDSQLLNYLNNSQPSLNINYAVGSGATATQFQIHLNQAAYTATTIERGKEWVENNITFTAVFNSADAGASGGFSPVAVTLQNAVPSGTYSAQ